MFLTVVQGFLIITVFSLDYCLAYVQPPIHVFLLYLQVGKHQKSIVHVYSHILSFEDHVTTKYPHYTLQKCIYVPNFDASRWGQIVYMDDNYIAETHTYNYTKVFIEITKLSNKYSVLNTYLSKITHSSQLWEKYN